MIFVRKSYLLFMVRERPLMTTFDLADARGFTADLDARRVQFDNGEGMDCADLDNTLRHYTTLCSEFRDAVRLWGREVFAGRVAFDLEVERILLDEGNKLYSSSMEMLAYGQKEETGETVLDGRVSLQSALFLLNQLLANWISPRLAVGPSARVGLASDGPQAEEIRRRLSELPPLPADWQPRDPRQVRQLNRLKQSDQHGV